ncbi:2Fe-2S iron-sulfur cluster-binding protein [Haloarchaeobius sp. HRN-SO-5]|uniref:2Fe-2S iron-sulfur cluster-binding protein n=1 Tax=Haloarchaeobius sp. HRN-SO-5 TaxID=3446118 RepID=UPI003EBF7AA0
MSGSDPRDTSEEGGHASSDRSPSYTLSLERRDGRRESVHASEDETVLDAAETAAVALPVGCLVGACTTCTGRVREGIVEHVRPPSGLRPHHLDCGYALLCIAEPRTDCRIEVGPDVQSDLVSNPWR